MKKTTLVILMLVFTGTFLSAQNNLGVGINSGYLGSTGDFRDIFIDGFGVTASITYNVNESLRLSATTGNLAFNFNNDYFKRLLIEAGYTKAINLDAKMSIIPLMFGAKYFIGESQFKPYGSLELGLQMISVTVPNSQITSNGVSTNKSTEIKTGYAIGAGVMYKISDGFSLDVNAKFNGSGFEVQKSSIKTQGNTTIEESSSSTAAFFSFMAGIWFQI